MMQIGDGLLDETLPALPVGQQRDESLFKELLQSARWLMDRE